MDWKVALAAAEAEYAERHGGSRAAMARMAAWMPGGDTRSTTWFHPFPLVMDHADGVEMIDVDGNVLLDFLGNYTALVHGHRPPFIFDAVRAALERDVLFGAPMREQGELARRIVERLASAERVRFTNSGTEAGMVAARIARRFTGRERLALAEHSYHGSYEDAGLGGRGAHRDGDLPRQRRRRRPSGRSTQAGPLAAVFLEPVLGSGGVITVDDDFLRFLREYTRRTGALLVFDEVMTFRLGYGGRQEATGVDPRPDHARQDHRRRHAGRRGRRSRGRARRDRPEPERQHGAQRHLQRASPDDGRRCREPRRARPRRGRAPEPARRPAPRRACRRSRPSRRCRCRSPPAARSSTSMPPRTSTTPAQADAAAHSALARYLHLALINRGVFIAHRGEMCISTPMTEDTVDRAVAAVAQVLGEAARLEGLA